MKKFRHILWVLLGVAASITLWSCEKDIILNNSPHPFSFYIEDDAGNNLTDRLVSEAAVIENILYINGKCCVLIDKGTERDVSIGIETDKYGCNYAYIDPLWTYTKIKLNLFDDDAEDIVFEAKNPKVNFYKITWMFKGKSIKRGAIDNLGILNVPIATLVRHDDGTYTLKE